MWSLRCAKAHAMLQTRGRGQSKFVFMAAAVPEHAVYHLMNADPTGDFARLPQVII